MAENASFRFGGEASLPLHYFLRLRKLGIEAWLIVHARTQHELQMLFPEDQSRIFYIPDRWYHRLIWTLSKLLPRRVSEATFGLFMVLINQLIQRQMLKTLVREQRINVVHQPIPVSPKAPSFIWGLRVPVIIGPMNGGMDYPEAFCGAESLLTRASVWIGRLSAPLANHIISGKRRASVLLVANERTRLALPTGLRGKIIVVPENGVDLALWSPASEHVASTTPPRFVFIGRLVDWKRLDLVLKALVDCQDAVLDVIGDGPMRNSWAMIASELGIAERINWLGWLPQRECAKQLQGATALVLPSVYECGGAVVLEAMACSIPVIALNWGGPAEYIDDSCGILIPPTDEVTIIRGFAEAQRTLAANPTIQLKMGEAGRQQVENLFDWNRKVDRILEIYQTAINEFNE